MDDLNRRYYLLKNRGDVSILTVPEEIDHNDGRSSPCCLYRRSLSKYPDIAYHFDPCDCGCHTII